MVNLRDASGRSLYFSKRKEYYRRKKISAGVKKYYEAKSFKKTFVEKVKKKIPTKKRTQLTLNSKYAVSLRAIGFKKTRNELDEALTEFLNSNPTLLSIPFYTEGFEEEEIGIDEDVGLSDDRITIELNIRGTTTYTEI